MDADKNSYFASHKEQCNTSRNKYRKKNLKRIPLDVQNDWYDILKAYCEEIDVPISTYIKSACEQVAEQNGFQEFVRYHETKTKGDKIENITPATAQAMSDENTEPATTPESEVPAVQPAVFINYIQ